MKIYIYRNLNKGNFSAKRGGRVFAYPTSCRIHTPTLQVSEKSQVRARNDNQRNVHAYIVCDQFIEENSEDLRKEVRTRNFKQLYYNPFKTDTFVIKDTDQPVYSAKEIILVDEKAYAYL